MLFSFWDLRALCIHVENDLFCFAFSAFRRDCATAIGWGVGLYIEISVL